MTRQRRHHNQEFKREAVALVIDHGYSAAAAGRSLGVHGALIGRWRRELEVNYIGLLATSQAFTPVLKGRTGAALVNVVSVGGLTNFPFFPTYSASKAAAHSLTQAHRILLAADGITEFGVYPGPVDTDMAKAIEMDKASPTSVAVAILEAIEAGQEDIFPDSWARDFAGVWNTGPKESERQIAAMVQQA